MTNPTDLGEITVVGQRRPNESMQPFPERIEINTPLPGDVAVIEPVDSSLDPCSDPHTKREWNIDAAAAKAIQKFLERALAAGEGDLNYRERGAFLLLQPDGSVTLGPIVDGDIFPPPGSTQQPSTQLVPQDIPNMAQIIGMIHNHAPGQHLPSPPSGIHGGDQAGMQTLVNVMNTPSYTQYNGGGGVNARFYIISQTTGPNPTYKLTVYGPETIKYDANGNPPSVGPEVNPNGQSCPI